MAIVSKSLFEREALALGDVWPTARYDSANPRLAALADGGRLFLVTVRPPDETLWLVGVLEQPRFAAKRWTAKANTTAIRDITAHKAALGITAKKGALGMSLQTPRILTAEQAAVLVDGAATRRAKAAAKAAPAAKATAAAKATGAAKATVPKTTTAAKATTVARTMQAAKRAHAAKATTVATATKAAPAALDTVALLASWRTNRAPRTADVLQTVTDDDLAARFAEIEKKQLGAARSRIDKLPDDPRVTVFLVALLREAHWPGSSARTVWNAVFARLVALKDRRAIEPLRALVTTPPYFLGAAFTAAMVRKIGETADALERVKATDVAVDADVAIPPGGWFAQRGVAANVEQILAEVWAHPEDMGVRSVAADVLLEQGDPWGELISLQLAGKRADALLKKIAGRVAGPIAEVAKRDGMVFEGGFLAEVRLDKAMVGRRRWEDAARTSYWSTVHTVRLRMEMPVWFPSMWLTNPALARLRTIVIEGGDKGVIERSDAAAPWKIARLSGTLGYALRRCFNAFISGLPKRELQRMKLPAHRAAVEIMQKAGYSAS